MNRWSKIVLGLTAVATLAWIGAGASGFRIVDEPTFARHTLAAFVALLALILGHGWVATFAVISPRLIGSSAGGAASQIPGLRAARRLAATGAGAAIAVGLAQFVISNSLFPGRMSRRTHLIAATVSVVVLIGSLLLEARALARHGRLVSELDR